MSSRRLLDLVRAMSPEDQAALEAELEAAQADSVEEQVKADEEAAAALEERLFGGGKARGSDHPSHAAVIPPPR